MGAMIGAEGARVGAHILVADAHPYAMYTTITSNDYVDIAVTIVLLVNECVLCEGFNVSVLDDVRP